ncbi:MAG: hypothetical protein WC468_02500 [Candidatus Paceibacterota bacterium]
MKKTNRRTLRELSQLVDLSNRALEICNNIYSKRKDLHDHRLAIIDVKNCIEKHIELPLGRSFPFEQTRKGLKGIVEDPWARNPEALWDNIVMMQEALHQSGHLKTSPLF